MSSLPQETPRLPVSAEDWIAVNDLLGRYAWLCDQGRSAEWAALWTEDGAVVGFSAQPLVGHAALVQIPKISFERFNGRMRHVLSNLSCEYREPGNVILARFYNHTTVWTDAPSNVSVAYCEAVLVRAPQGWKVQRVEAAVQTAKSESLDRLLALEEIRQLKARCLLAIDIKDAQAYSDMFSRQGVMDLREFDINGIAAGKIDPGPVLTGGNDIAAFVLAALKDIQTMHKALNPIIEFSSVDKAGARWQMEDWMKRSGAAMRLAGFGWYEDRYVREEDRWRIASSILRRWTTESESIYREPCI